MVLLKYTPCPANIRINVFPICNAALVSSESHYMNHNDTDQLLVSKLELLGFVDIGFNEAREDVSSRTKSVLISGQISFPRFYLLLHESAHNMMRSCEAVEPANRMKKPSVGHALKTHLGMGRWYMNFGVIARIKMSWEMV